MPALVLNTGNNTVKAVSTFQVIYTPFVYFYTNLLFHQANKSPQGLQTLNDFVGGKDVELAIAGTTNSTSIASLASAMESLNISANLPALQTKLLDTAALEILP